MQARFLLAAGALATIAACSGAPTAPHRPAPGSPTAVMYPNPDGTCDGGYHIATRSDGSTVCE